MEADLQVAGRLMPPGGGGGNFSVGDYVFIVVAVVLGVVGIFQRGRKRKGS
jgi:hypothetical protein